MSWGEIVKAAAALLVDLAGDAIRERRERSAQGWTYQDVKRVNDIARNAGHEHAERDPQR